MEDGQLDISSPQPLYWRKVMTGEKEKIYDLQKPKKRYMIIER